MRSENPHLDVAIQLLTRRGAIAVTVAVAVAIAAMQPARFPPALATEEIGIGGERGVELPALDDEGLILVELAEADCVEEHDDKQGGSDAEAVEQALADCHAQRGNGPVEGGGDGVAGFETEEDEGEEKFRRAGAEVEGCLGEGAGGRCAVPVDAVLEAVAATPARSPSSQPSHQSLKSS